MKPTAIRCSRCAVPSITARWIRCLCGTNSGYGKRQNDRMLPSPGPTRWLWGLLTWDRWCMIVLSHWSKPAWQNMASLLLCEFARKKENPSLERHIAPPSGLFVVYGPQHSDAPQRSQASRLHHLLFEVMAVATPHVAYSFVTKSLPALHTFDRAGGVAGTRRETKSQSSRCSYLSEKASICAERFRHPSDPFAA